MEHLFPRALLACIGEDRSPEPQELSALADKVRREAFPNRLSPDECHQAMNIARAAFVGQQLAA